MDALGDDALRFEELLLRELLLLDEASRRSFRRSLALRRGVELLRLGLGLQRRIRYTFAAACHAAVIQRTGGRGSLIPVAGCGSLRRSNESWLSENTAICGLTDAVRVQMFGQIFCKVNTLSKPASIE